ncbi:MAG TPA: biosynthetic peptidoglycan transglycosylase [Bacteroidales bacterium]
MRKRFFTISGIVVVALVILFFSIRGMVLRRVLEKIKNRVEQSTRIKLTYERAGFAGIKTVYLQKLNMIAENGDTVFHGDSIVVNPKLLPLLTGRKRIQELDVYHSDILLNDSIIRLLRTHRNAESDTLPKKLSNYAQKLFAFQRRIFTYIPNRVIIRNSGFYYKNDSVSSSVFCANFNYQNNSFLGEMVFADKAGANRCLVHGSLHKGSREMSVTLAHQDSNKVVLPFLKPLWQTSVGFDTLSFAISFKEVDDSLTDISGLASASGLSLQHKRIGPEAVSMNSNGFNFLIHVGDRYVELDSSSVARINKFSFSPYLKFENNGTRSLTFAFIREEFKAQELFDSMPEGLFTNFAGIKTEGNLAYHMRVSIDFNRPDSVKFESQLENKGFKIDRYGVTDFRMMNGSFVHDVYENDRFFKSILVGSDNPDFVPLGDISPYFKFAVLTAEDGDFYYHKGFNQNAFRESIATNIKEKRFARGGSTISMQLVKNVFLSKNKTVSRKIEEALIVWIIENLHLVSKDRMFEVYLNIMELGPGVYGIKPAAHFYFKKSPAKLNLTESIYLASIIPRPKGFRYTFDENGNLRDYFNAYFKLLSGIMVRRSEIPAEDTINLKPKLKLTGEARKMLAQRDTTAAEDSLFFKLLVPGATD